MPTAHLASVSGPAAVRMLNPLEISDWDARLALLPGTGFFHSVAWARVLHSTYGFQPCYLAETDSGRLQSVLPLMEVSSWLTGRRAISLPFTDAVEPLCSTTASFHSLWAAAQEQASQRDWKYLECRGGKKWFPDAPASTSFLVHRLALAAGESSLWSRCENSVRRAVRKAEHSALTVEFCQDLEAMKCFYSLLARTRKRHGVPPQPFRFFENICTHVLARKQGWIVLARQGAIPVAGAVFFHHGRGAIYKFGASDETLQHLRANNLVMWRAIQHYAREGYAILDLGRTSLGNDGLRKYKLSWGTQEERTEYVRFDRKSASFVTARDEASGWHNRLFRNLPIPLSRSIGALLYRHIA